MDWQRWRLSAESAFIRSRGWVVTLVQLVGIAGVLVAAGNILLAGGAAPFVTAHYAIVPDVVAVGATGKGGIIRLADVLLMATGAAVAWFI